MFHTCRVPPFDFTHLNRLRPRRELPGIGWGGLSLRNRHAVQDCGRIRASLFCRDIGDLDAGGGSSLAYVAGASNGGYWVVHWTAAEDRHRKIGDLGDGAVSLKRGFGRGAFAISPDGETLAGYANELGGRMGPTLFPTAVGGERRLLQTHIAPRGIVWSPDGALVAYWGGQGSGAEHFTLDLFDPRTGERVTRIAGASQPQFVSAGRLLIDRWEGAAGAPGGIRVRPATVRVDGRELRILDGF